MDTHELIDDWPACGRARLKRLDLLVATLCIAALTAGCSSGSTRTGAGTTGSRTEAQTTTTTVVTRPNRPPVRPRGAFLVMVGGGAGASTGDIFLVNAGTGAIRLVAKGVELGEEPRWSPDGRRILASAVRDGSTDVLSYPIRGGRAIDLTPTRSRWESQPRSSPDGMRVAFLSQRGDTSDNDVYVVPAVGGRPRLVVRHADGLAWSPDSRFLAFAPGVEGPARVGLWLVSASAGPPRPLGTGGSGDSIEWGPGRRILYTASGAMIAHPTYLWTASGERQVGLVGYPQFLTGGTVGFLQTEHKLGFLRPSGSRVSAGLPDRATSVAWSPDGRYLAFASAWTGKVYIARADGSGPRRLPVNFGSSQIEVFGWQPGS